MQFYDLITHSKANAGTATLGAAFEKLFFDPGQFFRRNSLSKVPDMHHAISRFRSDGNLHPVAIPAVFAGIVDDVQKHLLHSVSVCVHHHRLLRLGIDYPQAFLRQHIPIDKHRIVQLTAQIYIFSLQPQASALHPGEIQQFFYHLIQTAGFLLHNAQTCATQCRVFLVHQRFRPTLDGGQRRPQLV